MLVLVEQLIEESLINFLRSGLHLLNETTGEPVANEAPIWKSGEHRGDRRVLP
jgi:hypothetical protein